MVNASVKIDRKDRKSLGLNNFKGVDLSTSPLRVNETRATKMRNLINAYGVNHKRNGWDQKKQYDGKINAIIPYSTYFLVHAGTKLYRSDTDAVVSTGFTLTNDRSDFVYMNGVVYLFAGDYYKYNGTFARVAGTIPTTTVNKDRDGVTDTAVAVLDDINLLTAFRKNKLVGHSAGATWSLDGSIDADTVVTVAVEMSVNGTLTTETYTSDGDTLKDGNGVTKGSVSRANGKVTLTGASTPAISNNSNITVTFSHASGNENIIRGMKFGALFGTNGNANRVFASGGTQKNRFYYTELDDAEYFPDTNYAECGQSAINGFARMSDTTLAVLKEQSQSEPTIYYTTGTTQTEYDSDGNVDRVVAVFTVTAGAIGAANVNRHAVANLAGDNMILTNEGVQGLVLTANLMTNVRNIRERSRNINEALKKLDLTDACGIVYDNKYFVCFGDVCYIADARFKFSADTDIDGSFNYEWWQWDNVPARVFADVGGVLYFGTTDGKVCAFGNGFQDIHFEKTDAGDLAIDYTNNKVQYNSGIDNAIHNGDTITFSTAGVYAKFCDATATGGVLTVTDMTGIYDGRIFYKAGDGTPHEVESCDRGAKTFSIGGNESGTVALYILLTGQELVIDDINAYDFKVKEYADTGVLDLAIFDEAVSNPTATLKFKRNVVAEWYTPIMDMGTGATAKTLECISVTTEPDVNGSIQFGYDTRNVTKLLQAKGVTGIFNFSALDFVTFSFDAGFASSYTQPVFERNFNYIIFKFYSDTDTDCAVAGITAIYKYNISNKGVR